MDVKQFFEKLDSGIPIDRTPVLILEYHTGCDLRNLDKIEFRTYVLMCKCCDYLGDKINMNRHDR